MPNKKQIQLVQMAVRGAGLRGKGFEGRYRLLLGQYRRKDGSAAASCKDLTNAQIDDLLAICESMGWRHPGRPADYYRRRAADLDSGLISSAQIAAMDHLAGDLGITIENLKDTVRRMSAGRTEDLLALTRTEAGKVIEALKARVLRPMGLKSKPLGQVAALF